ncbi:MAG: ribosome silencing factor [Proteobacteria bacterium]|nr:MAG: ribosome silencing factor [Pseudomonadota bacterium]PIE66672.1 MAG: ribosome silencing factor [Deltaproteobacteria bacterium]
MTVTPTDELDIYVKSVLGMKAGNPVLLDVRHMTSVADAFLICHGMSSRQASAIAEHVQRVLKKQGIKPLSVDGIKEGQWILMDYGHVVIHVFYESTRRFYNLEGLWSGARSIQTPSLRRVAESTDPEDGGADFDDEADEIIFIE